MTTEKGIEGKKGVLFWDIAEIIAIKKPPFVLLENVDRLLKSPAKQRGRDFGIMLRTFDDLGYNVEWRIINAAEYGGAQKRKRIFIYAWSKATKYNSYIIKYSADLIIYESGLFAKSFPILQNKKSRLSCVNLHNYDDTVEVSEKFIFGFENAGVMVDGLINTVNVEPIKNKPITLRDIRERRSNLDRYFLSADRDEKFAYLKGSKKIERKNPEGKIYYYSEGTMTYPDSLDMPGRTMLTSEGTLNRSTHVIQDYVTGKNRILTPIEAERLQDFPDDWTNTGMTEKRRYFMMGNALVTKIINTLEPELSKIIENE